jgi:hypothetical protein
MCPYVPSFGVDSKYRFETNKKWVGGWSVSSMEEVVVLEPVRERMMVDDPPASSPHLLHEFLRLLGSFTRPWQEVIHSGMAGHLQIVVISIIVIVSSSSSLQGYKFYISFEFYKYSVKDNCEACAIVALNQFLAHKMSCQAPRVRICISDTLTHVTCLWQTRIFPLPILNLWCWLYCSIMIPCSWLVP